MSKVVKKTKKYALRENGEMWTRGSGLNTKRMTNNGI